MIFTQYERDNDDESYNENNEQQHSSSYRSVLPIVATKCRLQAPEALQWNTFTLEDVNHVFEN